MVEQTENGLVKPRAEKTAGGQLWINTPVSGLRIGAGAQRLNLTGTALVSDRKSEYRKTKIHDAAVDFQAYYVYAGVNVTSRLSLHGQLDSSSLDLSVDTAREFRVEKYYEDWTAGATFAVRPDVVLKAEYHWSESQLLETNIRPLGAPSRPVNYGIVSMSVSF